MIKGELKPLRSNFICFKYEKINVKILQRSLLGIKEITEHTLTKITIAFTLKTRFSKLWLLEKLRLNQSLLPTMFKSSKKKVKQKKTPES